MQPDLRACPCTRAHTPPSRRGTFKSHKDFTQIPPATHQQPMVVSLDRWGRCHGCQTRTWCREQGARRPECARHSTRHWPVLDVPSGLYPDRTVQPLCLPVLQANNPPCLLPPTQPDPGITACWPLATPSSSAQTALCLHGHFCPTPAKHCSSLHPPQAHHASRPPGGWGHSPQTRCPCPCSSP